MVTALKPSAQRRVAGASTGAGNPPFWQRNALALVCFGIFAVLVFGLVLTGHDSYNADRAEHGQRAVSIVSYLGTGHFWEALFENWESEFLQMAAFVILTVFLIQKGSAESKDPERHEAVDDDPHEADLRKPAPGPVRKGGIWLLLYENSLFLAFLLLFIGSIVGHAVGGLAEHNSELADHGQATVSLWGYASSSQFWFESIQNWQSEFLAVFAIVVLSIFLRQRGSPESKPVAAPHRATGSS